MSIFISPHTRDDPGRCVPDTKQPKPPRILVTFVTKLFVPVILIMALCVSLCVKMYFNKILNITCFLKCVFCV